MERMTSEPQPNSPQAKYTVEQIAAELRAYAEEDRVVTSEELALRIWKVSKRIRPVKPRNQT